MLQPDFNPEPVAVRIYRCGYVIKCKARSCLKRATVVAEKVDNAGRHAGQVELRDRHCDFVIARESDRGLEISDRRGDWVPA
jgi:hypothetical protein